MKTITILATKVIKQSGGIASGGGSTASGAEKLNKAVWDKAFLISKENVDQGEEGGEGEQEKPVLTRDVLHAILPSYFDDQVMVNAVEMPGGGMLPPGVTGDILAWSAEQSLWLGRQYTEFGFLTAETLSKYVPEWAMSATKPSYVIGEIGGAEAWLTGKGFATVGNLALKLDKEVWDDAFSIEKVGKILHTKLPVYFDNEVVVSATNSGAVGGTSDYTQLENLPTIGGVTVIGAKTLNDYGLDLSGYALTSQIPNMNGYATQTWVTSKGYALASQIPSLNGYATQTWVTSKGYLTTSSLNGFATESWVSGKLALYLPLSGGTISGTLTVNGVSTFNDAVVVSATNSGAVGGTSDYTQLENLPTIGGVTVIGAKTLNDYGLDLSGYALTSQIPNMNGYATQTWVTSKGYALASQIPSLNGYATQTWVTGKGYLTSSSLNGYATESWVSGRLALYLPLSGGTISGALTVNGVSTFNDAVVVSATNSGAVGGTSDYTQLENLPTIGGVTVIGAKTLSDYGLDLSGYALTSQIPNMSGYIKEGDSRLTDYRNALDVYAWAKQANKPSYTYSEVGAMPARIHGYGGVGIQEDTYNKTVLNLGWSAALGDYTQLFCSGQSSAMMLMLQGNGILSWNGSTVWHTGNFNPDTKLNTSASCNKNWNWSGQVGQPAWLWGGNDATNQYLYNPSNFSVSYAVSAGNADTVDNYHAHQLWRTDNFNPAAYLPLSGGTISGALTVNGVSTFNDAVVVSATNSGAVGGTSDYTQLENLPTIGGVTVIGAKTLSDYGLDLSGYALTSQIPNMNGYATQTWVTSKGYALASQIPSLNGYATQTWVTGKGYLTTSSLNGYATESWVSGKLALYLPLSGGTISGALTVNGVSTFNDAVVVSATNSGAVGGTSDYTQLENLPTIGGVTVIGAKTLSDYGLDLSGYALTSQIPNMNGYATQTWVTSKGYALASQIPSLNGYATQTWVTGKGYLTTSSLNGYATESWVSGKLALYLPLSGGTISGALTVNGVSTFNDAVVVSATNSGAVGGTTDYTQLENLPTIGGVTVIGAKTLSDYGLDLSGYALTSQIPNMSGYATQTWVTSKGYLTTSSLNGYIKEGDSRLTDARSPKAHDHTTANISNIETWINAKSYATITLLNNKLDKSVWDREFDPKVDYLRVLRAAYFDDAVMVNATGSEGGGGGTTDYNDLTNKPKIGGAEVINSKTLNDYGLASYLSSYALTSQIPSLSGYATESWVNNKGYALTSQIPNMNGYIKEGDSRLTDYRNALDVYAWAKAASKPSYNFSEIGSKPTTLGGYGISDGVLTSLKVGNTDNHGYFDMELASFNVARLVIGANAGFGNKTPAMSISYGVVNFPNTPTIAGKAILHTDNIAAWAKQANKPSYTYSEVGAMPAKIKGYGGPGIQEIDFGNTILNTTWTAALGDYTQILTSGSSPQKSLILQSSGILSWNGSTVWHTGNFNPAAYLPLSGGTMSGNLIVPKIYCNWFYLDGISIHGFNNRVNITTADHNQARGLNVYNLCCSHDYGDAVLAPPGGIVALGKIIGYDGITIERSTTPCTFNSDITFNGTAYFGGAVVVNA